VLRVPCLLPEFKFWPKFLGYFTSHRWGAVVISRKDDVSSGDGASCVVFCVSVCCEGTKGVSSCLSESSTRRKEDQSMAHQVYGDWELLERARRRPTTRLRWEGRERPYGVHPKSKASEELQMSRATVHKVLRNRLCLCANKMQIL
jgi:hypothetical protein